MVHSLDLFRSICAHSPNRWALQHPGERCNDDSGLPFVLVHIDNTFPFVIKKISLDSAVRCDLPMPLDVIISDTSVDPFEAVHLESAKRWAKTEYKVETGSILLEKLRVMMQDQRMDPTNYASVSYHCERVQCALDHLENQVKAMHSQYSRLKLLVAPTPPGVKTTQQRTTQQQTTKQLTYLNLLAKDLHQRINGHQQKLFEDITQPLTEHKQTVLGGERGLKALFDSKKRYLNCTLAPEAVRLHIMGRSVIDNMKDHNILPKDPETGEEFAKIIWEPESRPTLSRPISNSTAAGRPPNRNYGNTNAQRQSPSQKPQSLHAYAASSSPSANVPQNPGIGWVGLPVQQQPPQNLAMPGAFFLQNQPTSFSNWAPTQPVYGLASSNLYGSVQQTRRPSPSSPYNPLLEEDHLLGITVIWMRGSLYRTHQA
jgi:hypothetical protein